MAKTLNQFLESYLKVKNPDEQKFVDKHVVAKHSDRNGNDDEVFKGSKVKPIDRRKDRHGYNPGEDEKVYEELKGNQHKLDHNKNGKLDAHDFKLMRKKKKVEEQADDPALAFKLHMAKKKQEMQKKGLLAKEEVEQIDEISKGTAMKALQHVSSDPDDGRSYTLRKKIGKKWPEMKDHAADAAHVAMYGRSKNPAAAFSRDKLADRAKTSYRMTKDGKANKQDLKARFRKEEAELEEKLNMDKASMGDVIKDFRDSNAPQFKGKSKEKRRVMAIAAKLTAERGGKPLRKEEKLADLLGDLTETHRRTMLSVFDKLNEDNQKKFLEACETPEGVEHMLDFAISHRGE